jgi:hypothetical protein
MPGVGVVSGVQATTGDRRDALRQLCSMRIPATITKVVKSSKCVGRAVMAIAALRFDRSEFPRNTRARGNWVVGQLEFSSSPAKPAMIQPSVHAAA